MCPQNAFLAILLLCKGLNMGIRKFYTFYYLRVSSSLQVHSSADVCAQPQEFTLGLADGYQHNWEIYLKQNNRSSM